MQNNQTKFKETELGEIPKDWGINSFGELVINLDNKRRPMSTMERSSRRGKFPYYGASGIIDYIDDYTFSGAHLLISEDGENLKSRNTPIAFLANDKFWVNNHAHVIKENDESDVRFLNYWFAANSIRPYLTGTTQPKLSRGNLDRILIAHPRKLEQQKIAEVLGALDEKIELNQKVNKTLESLAQAVFRKWFIDDADPGWETKKLGELLNIDRGLSYKGKYLSDVGTPMFNLGSFNLDGSLKLDTLKYYSGDFKSNCTVNARDIIVANTDMTQNRVILGSPCIIPDLFHDQDVLFTHHLYALRPVNEINKMFIYRLLKTREFKDQAIGFATGTTVLFLPKEAILNYEIKYPSVDKIKDFNGFYCNILDQQLILTREIETLSQIRDSLLPRLMSGKLRVK